MRVRFFDNFSIHCQIIFSLSGSTAEVASSKMIYSASVNNALAMPIICFCPPDRLEPDSLTIVSKPSDILRICLSRLTSLSTCQSFSSVADGFASKRLFRIVSLNKFTVCGTITIYSPISFRFMHA